MQSVSDDWGNKTANSNRRIGYGALVSWLRTTPSGVRFFTINQSTIGGADMIKGAGSFVTFFDKYQYEDVSPFVISLSTMRKLGRYPFGLIMSEADIELDNTTKRFLPNYDTTIGSGILPNRPVKLSLGIEDEFVKLFTGFTTAPDITLNNRAVSLHAFDAFDFINGARSTISGAFINAPFHNIVASGLADMGFTSSQSVIEKSLQQNIGYLATSNRKWGDIFREGTEAEQGLMMVDEDGLVRFMNRQHFLTSSGVASFNLNYSKISDIKWQNTPVINDVIVRAKPRELLTNRRVFKSETPLTLEPDSTKDFFFDFVDEDGALPVTEVVIPEPSSTASAGESFFTTNDAEDGTGSSADSDVSVTEIFNFGDTYKVTFQNTASTRRFVTELSLFGRPAKVSNRINERYEDQTSIDTYGRNPANNGEPVIIENDLIQDESTAHSLAYTLVNEYSTPRKRYTVPLAVQSDPALQIGDQGNITINDTNETKTVYIVGITNVLLRNGDYTQTLELEERNIKQYFTINQSAIGGTDSIAP